MQTLRPDTIAAPFGRYSHGVAIPAGWRIATTSGQLPLTKDGSVPDGALAQATLCFENCAAILAKADMGAKDVIKIAAFVTDRIHMQDYMAARDAWLDGCTHLPASTLIIVTGFTRPEFLIEVEVTAAKP